MRTKAKHLKPSHFYQLTLKNKILFVIASISLVVCLTIGGSATYSWLATPKSTKEVSFTKSTITAPTVSQATAVSSAAMIPGNTITVNPKVAVGTAPNLDCWLIVKVAKSSDFDTLLTASYASGWSSGSGYIYRTVASGSTGTWSVFNGDKVTVNTGNTTSNASATPSVTITAALVQKANRSHSEAYTTSGL